MDANRFDSLSCSLTDAHSRRGTLAALLGGTLGLLGITETDAKKGKKKKKKKKKGGGGSPPASPPSPPPPPAPVATADASCVATGGGVDSTRQAQTFRALRSGQLSSATVFLRGSSAGADFDVEIWSVDQANAPSAVLAGTTITNVPATSTNDPPRRLTASFGGPATVVEGLRYALVITDSSGLSFLFRLEGSANNPCGDGMSFTASSANAPFEAAPTWDLHFETIVTA